jgi:metal-dependent amidase/aminoacylase/carboxypeptidase family protein
LEATVFRKLTLAAAAGAGYVLGAKAGKERYDQIEAKFREIAGMPAVQNATATVKDTASTVADQAKATVTDTVGGSSTGTSTDSGSYPSTGTTTTETDVVVVDLGTGANTGTTSPIGGARPSDTV